jgi:hypothetical protein
VGIDGEYGLVTGDRLLDRDRLLYFAGPGYRLAYLRLADADQQYLIVFEIRGNKNCMRLGNRDDHLIHDGDHPVLQTTFA